MQDKLQRCLPGAMSADTSADTPAELPADAQTLPLGAHLVTPRWGYLHHGIHAGGGRVIHYAGFKRLLHRGPVEEVPLAHFTRGRALQVQVPAAPRFGGAAAVERARSRLGEDRYRFWSNNCEHLVAWCITGHSRSAQVEAWREPVRKALEVLEALFTVRGAARGSAG